MYLTSMEGTQMADKYNILAVSDTPEHAGHEIIQGTAKMGTGMEWWCATCSQWLPGNAAHFPAPEMDSAPRLNPIDVGFDLSLHPEIKIRGKK